jgi:hypothetical protein
MRGDYRDLLRKPHRRKPKAGAPARVLGVTTEEVRKEARASYRQFVPLAVGCRKLPPHVLASKVDAAA